MRGAGSSHPATPSKLAHRHASPPPVASGPPRGAPLRAPLAVGAAVGSTPTSSLCFLNFTLDNSASPGGCGRPRGRPRGRNKEHGGGWAQPVGTSTGQDGRSARARKTRTERSRPPTCSASACPNVGWGSGRWLLVKPGAWRRSLPDEAPQRHAAFQLAQLRLTPRGAAASPLNRAFTSRPHRKLEDPVPTRLPTLCSLSPLLTSAIGPHAPGSDRNNCTLALVQDLLSRRVRRHRED